MNVTDQIKELLAAGKRDEAAALLKEAFDAGLSQEEIGAELAGFAETYLELATKAQEEQIARLEEGLQALEALDRGIAEAGAGEEAQEIRSRLGMDS